MHILVVQLSFSLDHVIGKEFTRSHFDCPVRPLTLPQLKQPAMTRDAGI